MGGEALASRAVVLATSCLRRGSTLAVTDCSSGVSMRSEFRRAVACEIVCALVDCPDGRARRSATRNAILDALEQFAVIERTRSSRPGAA